MGKIIKTDRKKLEVEEETEIGVRKVPPVFIENDKSKIIDEFIEDSQDWFVEKGMDMKYVGLVANELVFVPKDRIIWEGEHGE